MMGEEASGFQSDTAPRWTPRCFVSIRVREDAPEEGASRARPNDDMGLVLTRVHRVAEGAPFAIAFPGYRTGVARTLGTTVLVFAQDRDTLALMLSNRQVEPILKERTTCSGITDVDDSDVVGWVRFVRDATNAKTRDSVRRRAQRRFEAGLRAEPPIEYRTVDSGLPRYMHESLHALKSGAAVTQVPIYVRAEPAEAAGVGGFNAFGLSKGGAVPVLRSMLADRGPRAGAVALGRFLDRIEAEPSLA